MKVIEKYPKLVVERAQNGGWTVCGYAADGGGPKAILAGIADDEGLLEWLAAQLSLPAPQLADALNGHPPATTGIPQELVDALAPFAALAASHNNSDDSHLVDIRERDDAFTEVRVNQLRALIRAAGLWTDDMEKPAPPPSADDLKAAVAASETQARPPNPEPDASQPEAGQEPPAGERGMDEAEF